MPKAIKKRISRKTETADFGETVADIRNKLRERQKTLAYAFFAAILLLIAIGAFVVYNRINAGKAQELAYEGYQMLAAPPAQNIPPADRFKNALQKFNASYAAKNNPAILLYVADCEYALGNLDETIKSLKKIVDEHPDPKIASLAYYKMAMTYIRKGDLNSALKTFDTLIAMKEALMQDMALMQSGKTLESMGRTAEAKNKYRELITRFPASPLLNDAKTMLGSQ